LIAFKNLKTNQRQSFDRVKRRYFNAAQDIHEVTTITEEIVRKLLIEEKENLSEDNENEMALSKQFSSTGHVSAKNLLKRTYKGNGSLNLESSTICLNLDAALSKPINTGPTLTVDRLQLYMEFYKDYNIDEIAKLYVKEKKTVK
jgi:hypothetical protein